VPKIFCISFFFSRGIISRWDSQRTFFFFDIYIVIIAIIIIINIVVISYDVDAVAVIDIAVSYYSGIGFSGKIIVVIHRIFCIVDLGLAVFK
jgi:hypothetical protein